MTTMTVAAAMMTMAATTIDTYDSMNKQGQLTWLG